MIAMEPIYKIICHCNFIYKYIYVCNTIKWVHLVVKRVKAIFVYSFDDI